MLTTYFDHALTLLSPYTVLSSLPCLSSMVSQSRMCSLFEQAVKIFEIRDIAWFSKYNFCDIKMTNGKAIQNIQLITFQKNINNISLLIFVTLKYQF